MPKKTTATETVAAAPARATKPKAVTPKPRVSSVKHSKAVSAPVVAPVVSPDVAPVAALSAHEQISKIAYGYWEARGFQPGSPEQDWIRAEQQYLMSV